MLPAVLLAVGGGGAALALALIALGVRACRRADASSSDLLSPLTSQSARAKRSSSFIHSFGWDGSCHPSTCACGSPMCEPPPCSRSAALDYPRQLAELERRFREDPRAAEALQHSQDTPPSGIMYCPDVTLFAHKVLATVHPASAAFEAFEHSLEFRKAHGVDELLLSPMDRAFVEHIRRVMPHSLHKTDRWGHPIYIERIGRIMPSAMSELWKAGATAPLAHKPASVRASAPPPRASGRGLAIMPGTHAHAEAVHQRLLDEPINAVVWYHFQMVEYARLEYERQARLHGRRVSKMVSILDLEGMRMGMFTNSACVERLKALSSLGDHVTFENLAAIWIVNAPWFFAKCWQAMSHLLVPRTAEKLRVFSPSETKAFLREVIDPENLPDFLGGTCRCPGGCVSEGGQPSATQRESDEAIRQWALQRGKSIQPLSDRAASAQGASRALARPTPTLALSRWLATSGLFRCVAGLARPPWAAAGHQRPERDVDLERAEPAPLDATPSTPPRPTKPPAAASPTATSTSVNGSASTAAAGASAPSGSLGGGGRPRDGGALDASAAGSPPPPHTSV